MHKNVGARVAPCKKQNEGLWVALSLFLANVPACLPKEGSLCNHLTWESCRPIKEVCGGLCQFSVYSKMSQAGTWSNICFPTIEISSFLAWQLTYLHLSCHMVGWGRDQSSSYYFYFCSLGVYSYVCRYTWTCVYSPEVHLRSHSLSAIHLDFWDRLSLSHTPQGLHMLHTIPILLVGF